MVVAPRAMRTQVLDVENRLSFLDVLEIRVLDFA
jgi:hypothetical protein